MKRTWIGAGLLAVLLAAGLLTGSAMGRGLSPGTAALQQAEQAVLAGDWEQARTLTEAAKADWERIAGLTASLTSQDTLERIEDAFAQLATSARAGDAAAYAAQGTALARELEALANAHRCDWWNFL